MATFVQSQLKSVLYSRRSGTGLDSVSNVVDALNNNEDQKTGVVPYNATETSRLLSDVLGGNSKTIMIVHARPEADKQDDVEACLRLGLDMRRIKNSISKNEVNKDIVKLRKTLDYWKDQAGLPQDLFEAVDFVDIADVRDQVD